jgi:hypothetical protein
VENGLTGLDIEIIIYTFDGKVKPNPLMKKLYSLISILFIALSNSAQTNVSGGIYANTTWTLAGSPYIVVDTVVVFPGVTLTIDPGVVVKFDNNKRLEIRGGIQAVGTSADSIFFTSNSLSPTPGIWNSVYMYTSTDSCHFSFCKFEYASKGLFCNIAPTFLDNSVFINNISGVDGPGGLIVTDSKFQYNSTGVSVLTSCKFLNCIISNNQTGVGGAENTTFRNCIINNNSSTGIVAKQRDTLDYCEIKFNGIGLTNLHNGVASLITSNIIESNNIGIQLFWYEDVIYCNKICGNVLYDLKHTTNINTDCIINNYWCTADSDTVAIHIYDGYDDVSLGLLSFMPIDTNQCYLTGCGLGITATVTNSTCDTCTNGSATAIVTNGFSPYSYTWYTSPIQYTQTATALAAGTYTVCVTDANGCTACNYNVFVDSTNCTGFSVNATATNASCSSCSDGTAMATITAGNPPYYYQWNTVPIQNTQTATGLSGGNYVVCVSDVYGCSACDSVSVGIGSCYAYYTIAASGSPSTYDLTNMATGTPPLTFDWSWGDGSPNDTGAYPSHTYATSGNYTICLNIIDSAGCTDSYCNTFYLFAPSSSPVTINVIPPISAGVLTVKEKKLFIIYPNPTSGDLTVQLQNTSGAVISIYNTLGEKVYSAEITNRDSYTVHTAFPAGIYFIEVRNGVSVSRERFVKQ